MKCGALKTLRSKLVDLDSKQLKEIADSAGVSFSWLNEFTKEKTTADPGFKRVSRVSEAVGLSVCIKNEPS